MASSPDKIKDQVDHARLHKTNNDTKNNAKAVSMECLQARMADGIDLALVTKQAHWNLKGPQFIGIHLMLDGFRDELDEWNDMMAERITQLGGTARGTVPAVGRATRDRGAQEHRRHGRRWRCRHVGPSHRGFARRGQAALVPGSPHTGAERHLPHLTQCHLAHPAPRE